MTFEQAVAFVLEHEGEWGAVPDDPGGPTRWGISSRAHPDVPLSSLTRAGAEQLYLTRYWEPCGCDHLPGPLRLAVFDGAVQHGPLQAIRLLQDALGVTRDGVVGPKTLTAAHALTWGATLVRFLTLRMRLYAGLPGWAVSKGGWTHRMFSLQRAVYETQGGTP